MIFFLSQQAIFIFVNPVWGFSYGSDPINDFHTANLMLEQSHFDLGQLGYATRTSYSYFPLLHLFTSTVTKISGIPLNFVAMYFIPILNSLLTSFALYFLIHNLTGLEGRERNLATLFFELSFVYTAFASQFVRETFAFPFVLLSLLMVTKLSQSSRNNQNFSFLFYIFFIAVVLSHHISSYLLIVLLAIMLLNQNVFLKNDRLNQKFFLSGLILGSYTLFVAWGFSITQITYTFEGLLAIFQTETSPSIMGPYEPWRRTIALTYYAILAVFTFVGGIKLLRQKRKKWDIIVILSFFVFAFVLSTLLRLSTSADAWGWTYYMSLRGTIWAFIGISILVAIGLNYALNLNKKVTLKKFFVVALIVGILAAGKFSQFPSFVDDPNVPLDVTFSRYNAALWLKENAIHGSILLVAPPEIDNEAFEGSRGMAPYAYLKEFFIEEERGRTYDKFSGYIPFIGGYFDQYRESPNVHIIYSNGDVEIGYKHSK